MNNLNRVEEYRQTFEVLSIPAVIIAPEQHEKRSSVDVRPSFGKKNMQLMMFKPKQFLSPPLTHSLFHRLNPSKKKRHFTSVPKSPVSQRDLVRHCE